MLNSIVSNLKVISSANDNWGKSEAVIGGDWKGVPRAPPGGLQWKGGGLKKS